MLTQSEINKLLEQISSGKYTIADALKQIAQAQHGEDIRASMYAGIYTCYKDGKAGSVDLVARQQIAEMLREDIAGLEIRQGTETVTLTAGNLTSTAITYDEALSGVPAVLISSNNINAEYSTTGRTESGFTLNVRSDVDGSAEISWIAIYGSSAALSELSDIRTAADGTAYTTAGEAVRGQISMLDLKADDLKNKVLENYSDESRTFSLLDDTGWTEGYYVYYGNIKENADFSVTDYIDITAYDQIEITNHHYATYAFYTADGNRIADTAAYGTIDTASTVAIDVYSGATYFRYSCKTEDVGADTVTAAGGVVSALSREMANNDGTVVRGINPAISLSFDELASNLTKQIKNIPNIKFDVDITFSGKISSFAGLSITHGNSVYNGAMVKIDGTNVTVYRYTDSLNIVSTQAHGLTISDFINVIVKVYKYEATVIVTTASGMFISERVPWYGGRSDLLVYAYPDTNLTDCQLSWHSDALKRGVWYFGDSYLDLYPHILNELGYTNAMFDGYSGRTTADAWTSLTSCLAFNNPNVIVWGMGMNNPDTADAINPTWQTYADQLIALCKERNIKLIFLTVPNTPTNINSFKNDYIAASGCDYIDIAGCVGATETGSGWYSELLSTDNVHPTTLGSQVIASHIITKLPQLRGE